MANPLNQLSPRFSASYSLTDKTALNFSAGRYFRLPAYTVMGYENNDGVLANMDRISYIQSDQTALGFEYNPDLNTKIAVEGFYKGYTQYPFLLKDSISLANLGADFGVIGNEPVASVSEGRAYGAEFSVQRRSSKGLYGIFAYTWVNSEFEDKTGAYRPSAWDSRHLVSLTAGPKFGTNWNLGFKWRYSGGLPYTPYDEETSSLIDNWEILGAGVRDFDQLNSQRLSAFHQLDVRVDKTWFYEKWSLNLYLDIQNLYNFQAEEQDILNVVTDEAGNPVVNPDDPSRYDIYYIPSTAGTVLPTIGIILDF
jgi:hypothetical protein